MAEAHQQASFTPPGSDQNGSKRKRDENGTPQQRSKRSRYISIACNECKRRKIRCNGQTPCQRCGNLGLECVYAPNCCNQNFRDSNEFRNMSQHILALQSQIDSLQHNLNNLRSAVGQEEYNPPDTSQYAAPRDAARAAPPAPMVDPALRGERHTPQVARFHGSTSNHFNMDVARSSLQNMGINASENVGGAQDHIDEALLSQYRPASEASTVTQGGPSIPPSKDPLWELNRDEALRLCNVYEDEMGLMLPILDIEHVMRHATLLYKFMDAATRNFLVKAMPGADEIRDDETDVLRLVLAIALVVEGTGQSELGQRLFDSVTPGPEARLLGNVGLKDVQILVLTAHYNFHSNDEGLAWRIIGLTARLCIELGLHQAATYNTKFAPGLERNQAIKIFWCIYTLDRRWSLGTGMSFALRDSDLDPELPQATDSAFLTAMIDYSKIGSKVWAMTSTPNNATGPKTCATFREEATFLDYQVSQWLESVPSELRFIHPSSSEYAHYAQDPNKAGDRTIYRLRVLLYLRANQMRILIWRPVLHSTSSILSGIAGNGPKTVVGVAKDTIRVLLYVNDTSDVYRTQQMCFNYFLLSALAVLFLAVAHAPAKFAEEVREEFHMALNLVRGLSSTSFVSKRLWRCIRSLKEVAPKLGIPGKTPLDDRQMTLPDGTRDDLNNTTSDESKPLVATSDDSRQHQQPHHHQQQQQQHHPQQQPLPPPPQHQQQQQQQEQGPPHSQAEQVQHDAHSSAAMAMAGLAGHPVDESAFFASQQHRRSQHEAPLPYYSYHHPDHPRFINANPHGMAEDLTSLFQAASTYNYNIEADEAAASMAPPHQGSYNTVGPNSHGASQGEDAIAAAIATQQAHVQAQQAQSDGTSAMTWGNEDEFTRIMRNMFQVTA